jgi:hypothetical protein
MMGRFETNQLEYFPSRNIVSKLNIVFTKMIISLNERNDRRLDLRFDMLRTL